MTHARPGSITSGMLIFKLLTADEMSEFSRTQAFEGSEADLRDGFIHLSAAHQVAATAAKHFADAEGLWFVAVEADALGEALKWEPSRGGDLFPHLYRPLRMEDVAWSRSLLKGPDGRHRFPEEIGP